MISSVISSSSLSAGAWRSESLSSVMERSTCLNHPVRYTFLQQLIAIRVSHVFSDDSTRNLSRFRYALMKVSCTASFANSSSWRYMMHIRSRGSWYRVTMCSILSSLLSGPLTVFMATSPPFVPPYCYTRFSALKPHRFYHNSRGIKTDRETPTG